MSTTVRPRELSNQPVLLNSGFKPSQGLGSDCGINGVQHLVHEALLQRPADSKFAAVGLCVDRSHMTETLANLQI